VEGQTSNGNGKKALFAGGSSTRIKQGERKKEITQTLGEGKRK